MLGSSWTPCYIGHSWQPGENCEWGYEQSRNDAGHEVIPQVEGEGSWVNLGLHWALSVVASTNQAQGT